MAKIKIIGHRGAKGLAPENTIASLMKAIEHGVDEIECDIRVTSDRVPILLHDPSLHDPAGNKLLVSDLTLAELQAHKPDLTTLDEAIRSVNRQVPLVIEIKPAEPVQPVVDVLQQYLTSGWQTTDFLLASFSLKTLQEIHAALPAITKVVNDRWSGLRATHRARQLGTNRIAINQRWLWFGFIRSMHRSGYELAAYTLNDAKKARRWGTNGLAGVVTDYPDNFERRKA